MMAPRSETGASRELVIVTVAGSAACAQQPHVTHVGGQAPSSWPGCS